MAEEVAASPRPPHRDPTPRNAPVENMRRGTRCVGSNEQVATPSHQYKPARSRGRQRE